MLVGAGLLVAACGSGGTPTGVASLGKTASSVVAGGAVTTLPSGASAEKNFQKALEYSQCMHSHGVANFPDPSSGGGLHISSGSGIDPNSPVFRAAQKTCRRYFPGPHLSQAQIAEQEASALKFAACMRKNGVPNFPDPQFGPNGARIAGPVSGVDPNSPTYQAAAEKCGG